MKTLSILYAIARADFLERVRRYSFLIMLGWVLYLGYAVNTGQITLRPAEYRGVFNSAWVGSMMALVVNVFLGWFGFYLVKNAIARDYETGVGQIIATTPLSSPVYALGKWLSNFAVLGVMVVVLMFCAVAMQMLQREDAQINLWALLAPFLFVALPFMALTAALAVLFESIGWLRGGLGNLIYFFLFSSGIIMISLLFGAKTPLVDWLGLGLLIQSMGDAARAVYPAYQEGQEGFSLGIIPPVNLQTFPWAGITWTIPVILTRLVTVALSLGVALLGALFFDRFDPSRTRPRPPRKKKATAASAESVLVVETVGPAPLFPLTALPAAPGSIRFRFGGLLLAELRLLLKGLPWWGYGVALALIIAALFSPPEVVRLGLLPAAGAWPILLWSSLGCRETRYDVRQMVFSAPQPLLRQLPAVWLAGFAVAVLALSGAAVKLCLGGGAAEMTPLLVGAAFIPSLALALGAWTGSSKAFEICYVLLWYLGPLNKIAVFDFLGASTNQYWPVYLLLSLLLAGLAGIGRARQMRGR